MYPLSDKDLDRMCREASEQNDVDQSASGWERLERKLDRELPSKKDKDRRRFLWIFFLAIAISGSGLVYLLNRNQSEEPVQSNIAQSTTNTTETKNSNTEEKISDNSKPISSTGESNLNTDNKQEVILPGEPEEKEQSKIADKDLTKNATDLKTGTDIPLDNSNNQKANKPSLNKIGITPNQELNANPRGSTSKNYLAVQSHGRRKNPAVVNSHKPVVIKQTQDTKNEWVNDKSKTGENNETRSSVQDLTTAPTSQAIDSSKSVTDENTTKNKSEIVARQTVDTAKKSDVTETNKLNKDKQGTSKINKNPFAFGITTGTDFSNINGTLKNKAGYNFGAVVSYNITPRFSINTGFSITKKFYSAKGSDFHPPKHYFTNYVDKLVSVDGSCFMWEMPINLRYDLFTRKKFSWYLNAGMSSYIMRRQDYQYDYILNNTAATKNWTSNSQQNEWFKIVNLSAGLEYKLDKKWSLQAEPYMKLPTKGLGFGQMNISSYGIMLGVRYRPIFR